jgi:hypothetical protein
MRPQLGEAARDELQVLCGRVRVDHRRGTPAQGAKLLARDADEEVVQPTRFLLEAGPGRKEASS